MDAYHTEHCNIQVQFGRLCSEEHHFAHSYWNFFLPCPRVYISDQILKQTYSQWALDFLALPIDHFKLTFTSWPNLKWSCRKKANYAATIKLAFATVCVIYRKSIDLWLIDLPFGCTGYTIGIEPKSATTKILLVFAFYSRQVGYFQVGYFPFNSF